MRSEQTKFSGSAEGNLKDVTFENEIQLLLRNIMLFIVHMALRLTSQHTTY